MNCLTTYATDKENTDMIAGIRETLAKTGKGYVKQNIPNILHILENDPFFAGKFALMNLPRGSILWVILTGNGQGHPSQTRI